ncbi:hypothetical protein F1C58_06460 [Glaciihabitans sp. INWT7]|nr:hypothetical protein F1C58_06460 [Glaciihabitans sp. INWT7]
MSRPRAYSGRRGRKQKNILLIVVAIIAVVPVVTGGFVQSLTFLLGVGVVLLILVVIAFLIRMISGRRNV